MKSTRFPMAGGAGVVLVALAASVAGPGCGAPAKYYVARPARADLEIDSKEERRKTLEATVLAPTEAAKTTADVRFDHEAKLAEKPGSEAGAAARHSTFGPRKKAPPRSPPPTGGYAGGGGKGTMSSGAYSYRKDMGDRDEAEESMDAPAPEPVMDAMPAARRSRGISIGRLFKGKKKPRTKKSKKRGKVMAATAADMPMMEMDTDDSGRFGGDDLDRVSDTDGFADDDAGEALPPRVRKEFPESLLFAPRVITSVAGKATVTVPLADTVTDWRVTALASTADGRFGDTEGTIHVFQPFFINVRTPRMLHQGDVITLQVGVFNYLESPQHVSISVAKAGWFEATSPVTGELDIPAGTARALPITIRVLRNGKWGLRVDARSKHHADAVEVPVTVDPGGIEVAHGGIHLVSGSRTFSTALPADALADATAVSLRIYGGPAATLEADLNRFLELPTGCLEQTLSRMDANLAALRYLEASGKKDGTLADTARTNLRAGYLKLLTHRSSGAFALYPTTPATADRGLDDYEAYLGLRTLELLRSTAKMDGVTIDPDLLNDLEGWARTRYIEPLTAPYVTVYTDEGMSISGLVDTHPALAAAAARALAVELPVAARARFEAMIPTVPAHVLALVLSYATRVGDTELHRKVSAQLKKMVHTDEDGGAWWEAGDRTLATAYGGDADLEATAIIATELLAGGAEPELAAKAVSWMLTHRSASGGWSTTSSTARAVEAIAALAHRMKDAAGRGGKVVASIGGVTVGRIPMPSLGEVATLDLTSKIGSARELKVTTTVPARVEVMVRYRAPYATYVASHEGAYRIDVRYGDVVAKTGEVLPVTVSTARTAGHAGVNPAVVRIPIAGTFEVDERGLERLVTIEAIDRFERDASGLTVYLDDVDSYGREFTFYLRAMYPGEATAGNAEVYEYYHPSARGVATETVLRSFSDIPR